MIVALIRPEHVVRAWQDLGPMLAKAQAADQADGRQSVFDGNAQLWAVLDNFEPIGAAITGIKDGRLLVWQIAGHSLSKWQSIFVETVAAWARSVGCTALYGAGRKGWTKVVEPMGFRRIPDIDGRPAWELTLEQRDA